MSEEQDNNRAMVIVAHPDDAEFLCGGTIAKLCSEGWEVYYVITTNGDKGSHDVEMTAENLASIRQQEQRAAAQTLGVKECVFLGYPDGFLEDTPQVRGQLVRLIRQYRPSTVITWDGFRRGFNHRDHRITGQIAADAVMPLSRTPLYYPEHLAEGLQPHRVDELLLAGSDQPDYYIDIEPYLEKKIDAVLCHASQIGNRSRDELLENWRRRAEEMAKQSPPEGRPAFAEAFRRLQFRR